MLLLNCFRRGHYFWGWPICRHGKLPGFPWFVLLSIVYSVGRCVVVYRAITKSIDVVVWFLLAHTLVERR